MRNQKQYVENDARITKTLLEEFASGTVRVNQFYPAEGNALKPTSNSLKSLDEQERIKLEKEKVLNETKNLMTTLKKFEVENAELKFKWNEADMELKRVIEQLKSSKHLCNEVSERTYFIQSERDYYKMKFLELSGATEIPEEKDAFTKVLSEHKREIESLKEELAKFKSINVFQMPLSSDLAINPAEIDADFTSTVATLIAQTKQQLQEESRRLQAFDGNGKGTDVDSEEDLFGSFGGEVFSAERKKLEEIEESKTFARRQKMLNSEFQELGQSIQLKEQLMEQLVRSQQQYSLMKSYYEQKLALLTTAVEDKQVERDKLQAELNEIEKGKSDISLQKMKEKEIKLRSELALKDEELKSMKKKQEELKSLTQVQSQYSRQLQKLESDISVMKKQRVDLSKTLQLEKKNHILALNEKVKEIEKLKKELSKASSDMKKLEKSKEIAENKIKDVASLFLINSAAGKEKGSLENKETKEGISRNHLKNLVPTRPLSMSEVATAATARAAIREINRHSARFGSKRVLSEDELKTKRWIDQRIAEISSREATVEALKRQYEQQLELLRKKELLERERSLAILQTSNQEGADEASHGSQHENIESKEQLEVSSESGADKTFLLTSNEEEKLLEIIEERIATVNGQLNVRNQKISDIEKQMHDATDIPGSDKALEVLKRTAAGSLPASHELIRLLFDMLIHSNKALQTKLKQMDEMLEKEKTLSMKNDDLQRQLISEKRNFDMELTSMNRQYEEKLQQFFQQIASFETIHSVENPHLNRHPPLNTPERRMFRPQSNNALLYSGGKILSQGNDGSLAGTPMKSFDSLDIQLTIALEENKFLKSQQEREAVRYAQIRNKCAELETIKIRLMRDIEDKNQQIKFLEEDRALFKDMVEDLKSGLGKMGKDGKAVIQSAKDAANHQKKVGLFGDYLHLSDDESDEEDSASIIGQFQRLEQEITRNGTLTVSTQPHKNIYDRLTNPSNFTGSMKNVFENDLESKRKKIQLIKNSSKKDTGNKKDLPPSSAGSNGTARFFPELLKSHSQDELDTVPGKKLILSANPSNSQSSQSLDLDVVSSLYDTTNLPPPTTPASAPVRRKSVTGRASLIPQPNQTSTTTVKLNLDHLSLEEDSTGHSSVDSQSHFSNDPLQSPNPPSNVFTRLANASTVSSLHNTANKSVSKLRRPIEEIKDNLPLPPSTNRTISPGGNKLTSHFQHTTQYHTATNPPPNPGNH